MRRRIRFRSTEPPRAFPTVNPTLTGLALSDRGRVRKKTVRLPEKWRLPFSYTRRKSACFSRCTDLGNLALEAPLTVEPVRLAQDSRCSTSSDIPTRNHHLTRPATPGGSWQPKLVAITRLHGNSLAPFGATTRKNRLTALGLHAAAETVLLGTFAAVGLECALGHGKRALL